MADAAPTELLTTEKAVDELVRAIQADLEKAAALIRQGAEVIRYVEQNTTKWLDVTPGRLHAKAVELDHVMQVLKEEGVEVAKRMKSEGRLPAVEVVKAPKAMAS